MTRSAQNSDTPPSSGLDRDVAAAMVLPVYGGDAHEATPGQANANRSIYGVATAAEVISKYRPAGLLLVDRIPFHDGFAEVELGMLSSTERLRCFVESVQEVARAEQMMPLLIVADQEGGEGSRLPTPALPSPAEIGQTQDSAIGAHAGVLTGRAARAHGVGIVLGPLGDLGLGNAAIGGRAFSSDPAVVATLATSWVRGLQTQGVSGVVKHWPGHGRANADSHVRTPVLNVDADTWSREELLPFEAAINADVAGVLVAHLTAPLLDPSGALASQSPVLVEKLRDELSFAGFTMSDALWMPSARSSAANDAEVAVATLRAGIDLLLAPPDPSGTSALTQKAPELEETAKSSLDRIARLRSRQPQVDWTVDIDELSAEILEFNANL